jgi:hypothetical protein
LLEIDWDTPCFNLVSTLFCFPGSPNRVRRQEDFIPTPKSPNPITSKLRSTFEPNPKPEIPKPEDPKKLSPLSQFKRTRQLHQLQAEEERRNRYNCQYKLLITTVIDACLFPKQVQSSTILSSTIVLI